MADVEIDGVNSKVYADQLDPNTGTTLTLGTSGDTISIPSGVTITNSGTDGGGFGVNTPAFFCSRQVTQSLGTSFEVVDINSEQLDTDGCFDTTTFRFTPVVAGSYYLAGAVTWKTSSDFDKGEVAIYENGTDVIAYANSVNRDYNTVICSRIINGVDADDYFDLRATNTGGATDLQGGVPKIWFMGFRLVI